MESPDVPTYRLQISISSHDPDELLRLIAWASCAAIVCVLIIIITVIVVLILT